MKTFKEFINEAKDVSVTVPWDATGTDQRVAIEKAKDSLGVTVKVIKYGRTAELTGDPSRIRMVLNGPGRGFGFSQDEVDAIFARQNIKE